MKIFFDTNVYVAKALLGEAAEQMLNATEKASWHSSHFYCETSTIKA